MPGVIQHGLPFVAFVGAGASVIPPSSLPTWNGFNNLALETLLDVLNEYTEGREHTEHILARLRERRDKTMFFAPDFQAQLMEDEIGSRYFSIWQSIDTDTYGPAHAGLAELAGRGQLAAIVTTNFDRLIELALRARGQDYRVYHDIAGFAERAKSDGGPLPVVKIHGSIEDSASLVDTLRQRVAGRPAALQALLQSLLRRHPWLFVGFSGADFSYDPHYLGILDSAPEAKGFVFLTRPGKEVQPGVRQIADAYRPAKAAIVEGEIVEWLQTEFALPPVQSSDASAASTDPTPAIRKRIRDWAADLGPMSVVNIVYAMLRSAGYERDAFGLMRDVWKRFRTADDTESKAYHRYNYNYGVSLLDVGWISNPVALAKDGSNVMDWKTHADDNGFEYLARSYTEGKLLASGGVLASLMAYRGEVGRALALAREVTDVAFKQEAWLDLCDIAVASMTIYDIVHIFGPGAQQLLLCAQKAKTLGDEPRRAALLARAGRLLTYSKKFSEAEAALNEAQAIATRLDLQRLLLTIRAARALWQAESGASTQEAQRELLDVVEIMHAVDSVPLVTKVDALTSTSTVQYGRRPELCRILLDLVFVAIANGDGKVVNTTLDELDELTTGYFPGYLVDYYVTYAGALRRAEGDNEARAADLMQRALEFGKKSGNPWAQQVLGRA